MQSLAGRVGGKGGGIVSFVVRVSRLESTCCHCAWCKAIQDILGVILVVKDNNLFLLKMLLHGGIFSQKHSKKKNGHVLDATLQMRLVLQSWGIP